MTASQSSLFSSCSMQRSAVFSECRRYRYQLRRSWDTTLGVVNFLLLNPSTADEIEDDPTITRQIERTRRWGYGGLVITNIFAWRSTDPSALPSLEDPIGLLNDAHIIECATSAAMVICGWGKHGALNGRGEAVRELLKDMPLRTLKVNGDGSPQHPLYIGYDVAPQEYQS